MSKRITKIIIDGKEVEVDFDTLNSEDAKKMGIHVQTEDELNEIKRKKMVRKIKDKIIAVTPLLSLKVSEITLLPEDSFLAFLPKLIIIGCTIYISFFLFI